MYTCLSTGKNIVWLYHKWQHQNPSHSLPCASSAYSYTFTCKFIFYIRNFGLELVITWQQTSATYNPFPIVQATNKSRQVLVVNLHKIERVIYVSDRLLHVFSFMKHFLTLLIELCCALKVKATSLNNSVRLVAQQQSVWIKVVNAFTLF